MAVVKEKGLLHVSGITASQIHSALLKKHEGDVIIEECKNGETWGARDLLRLDAWVLRRTYSPLTTIGYEVKVDRQDFERDQKWVGYLELCHEFYFVSPAGLIRSTDLPQEVGLYWTTMSGDKVVLKKHAARHQPNTEKLNRLLIYALMSRSKIVADMNEANRIDQPPKDRIQDMKDYLARCEERKELAYQVKGYVRKVCEDAVIRERNAKNLEDRVKRFESHLARLGITWDSNNHDWQDNQKVDDEISMLKKEITDYDLQEIKRIGHNIVEVATTIAKNREAREKL